MKEPTPSAAAGVQPWEMPAAGYPSTRLRRNRRAAWSRRLVRETTLTVDDLIWPIFVIEGEATGASRSPRCPASSGCRSISAVQAAEEAAALGIPVDRRSFPIPTPALRRRRRPRGLNPDNLVCRAVRAIKAAVPEIGVMCDVALDPYTSHGHDGLMRDGEIVNDETLAALVRQAWSRPQPAATSSRRRT